MADKTSLADKQYLAKILFTREHLEQKAIAQKVGVSENTISKWVNTFNWRNLRNRLLVGKEEILSNLYEQLENLSREIREEKSKGNKGYADSRQSDILIKLTAAIRNMETELAIADLVESGIRFGKYLQKTGTMEQVIEYSELWHSFLNESIKK